MRVYACTPLPFSSPAEHAKGMHYKDGILTKMGDANELMVYHQHHCWILFTSLTLTLAKTLNYSKTSRLGHTHA